MKYVSLLALPPLAFLLAACNGPSTVEPNTLNLNGTGSVPNITVTTDLPLTAYFWGTEHAVGTLKADKTVSITLTPAMYEKGPAKTLNDWRNSFTNCDTSGLNVLTNTTYLTIERLYYENSATVQRYIIAGTRVDSTDGTRNYNLKSFTYVKAAGAMKGKVTCGTWQGNYDLDLKPGWNIINMNYTADSTGTTNSAITYTTEAHTNVYNGGFRGFFTNRQ